MDRRAELLRILVSTPSQVSVNDPGPIIDCLCNWLTHNDVEYTLVGPRSKPLAVVINPPDDDSEVLLLDACLDTAPVGDLDQWTAPPFSGEVRDGWLFGRGAADSKAAVAIFSELATRVHLTQRVPSSPRRHVTILFDCDEHSGRFGGIKAYTSQYGYPKYCVIGYPGIYKIVAGSRGFFRTTATLRGSLAHAGSGTVPQELATNKLAALLVALRNLPDLVEGRSSDFPLPPRASITWIRTGVKSYSITPAKIECAIDIRLTLSFGPTEAQTFLEQALKNIDQSEGPEFPSTLSRPNFWPAYRTPDHALLPSLLQTSAARHLSAPPPFMVSGPSNIGNYLAMNGTEVLSGFGVDYRGIHGADECIRVDSLDTVSNIYADLLACYLDVGSKADALHMDSLARPVTDRSVKSTKGRACSRISCI